MKEIVEKTEHSFQNRGLSIDLSEELERLEEDSLVCRIGSCSAFEKNIKINIKMILGIFFVAIPLIAFTSITYLLNFEYSYAFILTFSVALFSSIRMEKIVKRYTQLRHLTLAC
ncbi:MAG: hypothetical protein WBF77_00680 [Sulfurimonadaceae bacterium]